MQSREEFDAMLDGKRRAVAECLDRIIAAEHEPRDFLSRRRNETIAMALVLDPERETPMAWRGSTDGSPERSVSLPKSQVTITHSEGNMVIMTMKAWIAADRRMVQANIPGLSRSVDWTDSEKASWTIIQKRIVGVRRAVRPGPPGRRHWNGHHSRKPLLTRNETA